MKQTTLKMQFHLPIENISKKHQTAATKKAKAAPFDDSLTSEDLAAEVNSALQTFEKPKP